MSATSPSPSLRERIEAISLEADRSVGVDSYEHLMVEALAYLESGQIGRAEAVAELRRLATDWPVGAPEVLEFTMRRLQWPEIRAALKDHVDHGADFRTRHMAAQVLEAFEDEWPAGEIYRAYREAGT